MTYSHQSRGVRGVTAALPLRRGLGCSRCAGLVPTANPFAPLAADDSCGGTAVAMEEDSDEECETYDPARLRCVATPSEDAGGPLLVAYADRVRSSVRPFRSTRR